jgi:menaquinone-dependent protoporphyrinogen IX oxidase
MKGLVAYHTKFGNCRKIAENIARGFEEAGLEVELTSSDARKVGSEFDFLAVGSGTRMGRMTGGIRRFIAREIKKNVWSGKPFLAFGTGVKPEGSGSRFDDWSVRGAQRIHETLEARGLKPVASAAKFYVEDTKGPLGEGEEERALQLGLDTGKLLLTQAD